jgi:hypothetical protein
MLDSFIKKQTTIISTVGRSKSNRPRNLLARLNLLVACILVVAVRICLSVVLVYIFYTFTLVS